MTGKRVQRPIGRRRKRQSPAQFIAEHPVFRLEELLAADGTRSLAAVKAALGYHVAQGRIVCFKRGLYTRGLRGIDPWLLGSRLTPDAVLAYDGALSFHDVTDLGYGMSLLSRHRVRYLVHNEVCYRTVPPPKALAKLADPGGTVVEREREGVMVRVTTLERAFVDCLDRPELGPGLEELCELLQAERHLDLTRMVDYARRLGHPIVAARLGLFAEHHRAWGQAALELAALERMRPSTATRFDPAHRGKAERYVQRWNVSAPAWCWDRFGPL